VAQLAEQARQVGDFLLQELADVHARRRSCSPECHDMSDFAKGQPKPTRTAHERQQGHDFSGVAPVA
jgi:hypothetical protein